MPRKAGRKRKVTVQIRRNVCGDVRYIVRWTEIVAGKSKRQSKSFEDLKEAELKAKWCRAILGIAEEVASVMDGIHRPSGELKQVIEQHVAKSKSRMKKRSKFAKQLSYYLMKLPNTFGWKRTGDIPADAFDIIAAHGNTAKTYTSLTTQRYLARLIKYESHLYQFDDRIVHRARTRHKRKAYYVWTDLEKKVIFNELTAPIHDPILPPYATRRQAERLKRRARNDLAVRQSLFLAIWPQVLWALRPNEVCLLQAKHWYPLTMTLHLSEDITKTGVGRDIVVDQITAAMLQFLTRDREPDEFIYRTSQGRPWKDYYLMSEQFRKVLKRLRIRGSLYSCRHYAASTLMEFMSDKIRSVMAITGHSSMEQLQVYVQLKGDRASPAAGFYDALYADVLKRGPRPAPASPPSGHEAPTHSLEHRAADTPVTFSVRDDDDAVTK